MSSSLIKRIRDKQGYSQTALGNILGVSQPMVSHWERGAAPIPDRIFKLLKGLNNTKKSRRG